MDTQHKLDLRGAIIPFTVLKVSLAFRTIGVGDSLEVLWSDPDTAGDLFKVLPAASFDLVTMDETIQDQPCYRVILVKRA
jgi:TusA-related sulfurtransferase